MVPKSATTAPCILGAGITGLAASWISGATAFEAQAQSGGICRSYTAGGYRFEIGGGHWIFGGDPMLNRFLEGLAPLRYYQRRSSVWLPDWERLVPYPLQHNLHALPERIAGQAVSEMRASADARAGAEMHVLSEWLLATFGPTLTDLFFGPFHHLYTAGEWTRIAVQDSFKTPVDLRLVERGLHGETPSVGYNHWFSYPEPGLDGLADLLAAGGKIRHQSTAVGVDSENRQVYFRDGLEVPYSWLVSTLPLDRMIELTGLTVDAEPGIRTSVLVLNLGGKRGPRMPEDHWVYVPASKPGFHRVGFYSNVDKHFLPGGDTTRASLYVEKAFRPGTQPSEEETQAYSYAVATELREWGWLDDVEVSSPTWVETAYTWSTPGSRWREQAIELLAERGILMTGRYGKWRFQGISDSLRDGFQAGASLRASS